MARRSISSKTSKVASSGIIEADPFRPTFPDAPQARARIAVEVQDSPLLIAIASVPPPPAVEPSTPDAKPVADPGDISGQFFAQEIDSVPPGVEMPSTEEVVPEPPHVVARRARARRVLVPALAVFAIFALLGAGKGLMTRAARASDVLAYTNRAASVVAAGQGLPGAAERPLPQTAEAASLANPVPAAQPETAPAAQPEPAPAAQPEPAPAAQPEPPPAAETAPPAADAAKLRKEAESLANRGRYADAITASRAAIEADPAHALPYLLLGSSLQMTGKWKDGVEAYCECVRNATKGPVGECRAAGGHK